MFGNGLVGNAGQSGAQPEFLPKPYQPQNQPSLAAAHSNATDFVKSRTAPLLAA